jgi:hypothetical protein
MSKAERYHSQAVRCDQLAVEAGREIGALWRSIAAQYRFLEEVDRRTSDPWLPREDNSAQK